MRQFILTLAIILGLVLNACAQPSDSNTNSVSVTPSFSGSTSISNTVTGPATSSNSNSITGSTSVTRTVSVTATQTWSQTGTWTRTASLTITPTQSVIPGPAPINVVNRCLNHIVNICPSWSDPAGFVYVRYVVVVTGPNGPIAGSPFSTTQTSGRISGLLPNTPYSVTVQGFEASGLGSLVSTAVIFTTDPADAKLDKTLDIHNITCAEQKNAVTLHGNIVCNWIAAAPVAPTKLKIKWRCVSSVREPDSNIKLLRKAAAAATTVTLQVNRDVSTCTIYFRAYYPRRPGTRHILTVIMGQ